MVEFRKHITGEHYESPRKRTDYFNFLTKFAAEHILDDKSRAQAVVQMQIVSQLELQLQKEKERLQAMMKHLKKKQEEEREVKKTKHQGRERRENGYLRNPEREISQPLSGPPKPLLSLAMLGLSCSRNLGGLGETKTLQNNLEKKQ